MSTEGKVPPQSIGVGAELMADNHLQSRYCLGSWFVPLTLTITLVTELMGS